MDIRIVAMVCATVVVVYGMSTARDMTNNINPVRDCIKSGGQYMWNDDKHRSCIAIK